MNKEVKKILVVLALFAFADGFFYNFQELWLAENNLSLTTIGTILSLGAIVSVSVIFLCSSVIKRENLKKFTCLLLLIKAFLILILFLLHGSGSNVIIKFLTIVDYAIDKEIYASIYPLITFVTKDDKLYAYRGLIYDGIYFLAVIVVGFLFGKTIGSIQIDYNFYCFVSFIILLIASFLLLKCDLQKYYNDDNKVHDYTGFGKLFKKLKNDKISICYMLYLIIGQISYYSVMALLITILTSVIDFTPVFASNLVLITGCLGVLLGFLILEKLTLKNDYINFSIKFVIRFILYVIAFICNSKFIILISLFFTKVTSSSYTHITDAPYINRFEGKDQMIFSNLKEMISYLGRSIGTLLCAILLTVGIRFNFLIAMIFAFIQIAFGFLALNLRIKEEKNI